MNCEMCGYPCRNPRTIIHAKQKVQVCWDCFRKIMRDRDKERRDLKPAKEAVEAGLFDVEMSHAVNFTRGVSQVLSPGTYPASIGKHALEVLRGLRMDLRALVLVR